jgi:predicted peptidase
MRLGRMIAALATLFLGAIPMAGQDTQTGFLDRSVSISGHVYPYQVYIPRDYPDREAWPVILFLHGAGERGDDGVLQTAVGLGPAIRHDVARYPAIIVFPQAPRDSSWTGAPAEAALAALDRTLRELATDPDRVYLTGISMGGHGSWYLAYRQPDRFAAVVPVCGWVGARANLPASARVVSHEDGAPFEALARRLGGTPTWIFHGEVDPAVPVEESRQAAAALTEAGGDVRYTELPGVGHNAWDPAYASPAFTDWLFAQRRR